MDNKKINFYECKEQIHLNNYYPYIEKEEPNRNAFNGKIKVS